MSLVISHEAGFFSCCTIKLQKIIEFYNCNKFLPESIISKELFNDYKPENQINEDITNKFFLNCDSVPYPLLPKEKILITYACPVKFELQFSDYRLLNYDHMKTLIDKYFSFSKEIHNCINNLKKKYNIDIEHTCAVFYRGNDKCTETVQPSYNEVILKTEETIKKNPNIKKIIVQTDEREFSEAFRERFPNSIVFTEIPDMPKSKTSLQYVIPRNNRLIAQQYYIAALEIISKCKHVIHTSGNGEMWMAMFRGNGEGLIQYLQPRQFYNWNNALNPSYDPNKTYFWISD